MAVDSHQFESLLVEHLPTIERVVGQFGRRYGMSADDIADLASSIKLRIVEDDYAVFRKFRGESSLSTYLTVVITMFAREHRVAQAGRWRPSAAAERLGAAAVGLETLVHKGYSAGEALQVLRSRGDADLSDRQLGELLRQLPRRAPLRPVEVDETSLRAEAAHDAADSKVIAGETLAVKRSVETKLEESLAALAVEDRLLLKLRFWQESSVADIARILGVEQRPLYRRLEKLLADLRKQLSGSGITPDQVRELIGGEA